MSLTNEEKLELAKKCGAELEPDYDSVEAAPLFFDADNEPVKRISFLPGEFLAYTSAIEEKCQAQIAMLRDALKFYADEKGWSHRCPKCGNVDTEFYIGRTAQEALTTTQATADAFIAEIEARAELAGIQEAISAIELLRMSKHDIRLAVPGDEYFQKALHTLRELRAEKRKQSPQTKCQPYTCDGRCDGLCLEQGKEKGK